MPIDVKDPATLQRIREAVYAAAFLGGLDRHASPKGDTETAAKCARQDAEDALGLFDLAHPVGRRRGLGVGTRVRVVRACPEWRHWVSSMANLVGKEGEIVGGPDREGDYGVEFSDSRFPFWFPFPPTVLEVVEAAR